MSTSGHVVALCGGVGGAKLAFGLTRVLEPKNLTLVVNTGDDFEHLGLHISPDVDTLAYTLAGLADRERGWGLAGETWHFMGALARLGGESWFNLGDRDLAMHVERTRRLAAGRTLSQVTAGLTAALGIRHPIIPMSDHPVRTIVQTDGGELENSAARSPPASASKVPIAPGSRPHWLPPSSGRRSPRSCSARPTRT